VRTQADVLSRHPLRATIARLLRRLAGILALIALFLLSAVFLAPRFEMRIASPSLGYGFVERYFIGLSLAFLSAREAFQVFAFYLVLLLPLFLGARRRLWLDQST
jgi:hypothetical protein